MTELLTATFVDQMSSGPVSRCARAIAVLKADDDPWGSWGTAMGERYRAGQPLGRLPQQRPDRREGGMRPSGEYAGTKGARNPQSSIVALVRAPNSAERSTLF